MLGTLLMLASLGLELEDRAVLLKFSGKVS